MLRHADPHPHRAVDEREEGEERGDQQRPGHRRQHCRAVVGAVGALVRAADFADTEDVERRGVERPHEEPLRPQGFDDDGLTGSGQVCHRVVPPHRVLEAAGLWRDVVEVPDGLSWKISLGLLRQPSVVGFVESANHS